MEFELRYRKGNFNMETRKWDTEWDIEVEAKAIFTGNIPVSHIASFGNSVTISLNAIPARIDVEDNGNVWLQDAHQAKLSPEPYASFPDTPSKIIWETGERELANIEECDQLIS